MKLVAVVDFPSSLYPAVVIINIPNTIKTAPAKRSFKPDSLSL